MSSNLQSTPLDIQSHSVQAAGRYTADKPTTYLCGDCGQDVTLSRGAAIRCVHCGYRVLMKKRTDRMVQFEAR